MSNAKQNVDPSRRQFLRTGAAAVGAAGGWGYFFNPAAGQQGNQDQPGRKLGFCFVGIGSLCMNQILPEIHHCKYCKPVALVSGHPDKARQQAQKHGIDPKNIYNYQNFDTIKDNPEIDVVYVVLPNSMHAEYTIRAAKAGKHVLCEKPMANSVKDCREMIEACRQAGRKLQIGYRLHFEPNTQRLIEAARKQEAGAVRIIENSAGFNIGDPKQWRLHKQLSGGGCLMDIGIYALNAARYISGQEPVEVRAMTYADRNDPRFTEVEEHCNFELRFPDGTLASCISSYGTGFNRFRAYTAMGNQPGARTGWIECDPGLSYHGVKFRMDRGRGIEAPDIADIFQFAAEMDGLAETILTGKPSLAPGEEGLKDLAVIEAIYQAAESGQAVKINPAG